MSFRFKLPYLNKIKSVGEFAHIYPVYDCAMDRKKYAHDIWCEHACIALLERYLNSHRYDKRDYVDDSVLSKQCFKELYIKNIWRGDKYLSWFNEDNVHFESAEYAFLPFYLYELRSVIIECTADIDCLTSEIHNTCKYLWEDRISYSRSQREVTKVYYKLCTYLSFLIQKIYNCEFSVNMNEYYTSRINEAMHLQQKLLFDMALFVCETSVQVGETMSLYLQYKKDNNKISLYSPEKRLELNKGLFDIVEDRKENIGGTIILFDDEPFYDMRTHEPDGDTMLKRYLDTVYFRTPAE